MFCFLHTIFRRRSKWLVIGLALLWFVFVPLISFADSLDMPSDIGASGDENEVVDKPVRGMTMDDVSAKYGEPTKILPPVGDPPITRWIYPNFTVNFERQYVIFAVVPHKSRQQ